MDFHKPKPWHGFREFLKEYLIIVVGVLTALAAEQVVEWRHWRHEAESEREALYEEATYNISAVKSYLLMRPCIERRLSELDLVFQRHDRGQPLGLVGRVGAPIPFDNSDGAWSLAVSGGGLNHMSEEERLRFSAAFSAYGLWNRDTQNERAAWLRLGVLDHPEALKDADWSLLRVALAEVHAQSALTLHYAPYLLKGYSLGQTPKSVRTPEQVFKVTGMGSEFCQPLIAR